MCFDPFSSSPVLVLWEKLPQVYEISSLPHRKNAPEKTTQDFHFTESFLKGLNSETGSRCNTGHQEHRGPGCCPPSISGPREAESCAISPSETQLLVSWSHHEFRFLLTLWGKCYRRHPLPSPSHVWFSTPQTLPARSWGAAWCKQRSQENSSGCFQVVLRTEESRALLWWFIGKGSSWTRA